MESTSHNQLNTQLVQQSIQVLLKCRQRPYIYNYTAFSLFSVGTEFSATQCTMYIATGWAGVGHVIQYCSIDTHNMSKFDPITDLPHNLREITMCSNLHTHI